jgi:DNA-binding response OmpR family regulator
MKNILLVEDDPFLIDIYKKKLESSGFKVAIAETGEKALVLAREKRPDLLILDIVLPELEGWEVLKRLKESKETKELKVIILSNLGQKEEVEKGLKLGAVKYLIKAHYTPSEIVKEIKETLKD